MPDLAATTDLCRLLGDPSRVRLLSLLAQEELTVAELVKVTHLAQSRVSTHLKKLREAGMLRDRRAGGSTYYALDSSGMPDEAAELWKLVKENARDPLLDRDREELVNVVHERDGGGGTWADSVAGSMARHYSPGRTWEAMSRAVVGLVRLGRVIDVASGDGAVAELLAPRADRVVCLDISDRIVQKGAERLAHLDHVEFVQGDMHQLPYGDGSFDNALLLGSLSYSSRPEQVLREIARVLVPTGNLVAVALARHAHHEVVSRYDHVHYGFEPDELRALLEHSGFDVDLCARTAVERRPPHFETITVHASRGAS